MNPIVDDKITTPVAGVPDEKRYENKYKCKVYCLPAGREREVEVESVPDQL